jgi:hypothetical protein
MDAEIRVEAVGDGVPWHLPAHPRLQPRDVAVLQIGADDLLA